MALAFDEAVVRVKTVVAVVALFAFAGVAQPAIAHPYSVTCTMVLVYPDQADTGIFSLLESLAPGAIPNGLFYCHVRGVQGGDWFTVTVEPDEPMVVGLADECPGPDWSPGGLVSGEDSPDEVWLLCNNPDYDIKFTGGAYHGGPGDEEGMVPGDGDAIISMFFGAPGSTVTYREGY